MRIMLSALVCFTLLAMGVTTSAQIWVEDFSDPAIDGKGAVGIDDVTPPAIDMVGVTNWTIDVSAAGLTAATDWFRVTSETFKGQDLDGEAVWESMSVDISGATEVSFSVDVFETGTMESGDYADISYSLDGGAYTMVPNWEGLGDGTHTLIDDYTATTVSVYSLSGSTLQLRVALMNGAGTEQHHFDNVTITTNGPPAGLPPVIDAIGPKVTAISNALIFDVTASDPTDGDTVTLWATDIPSGATFASNSAAPAVTNTFTWLVPEPVGVYTTTFWAADVDGVVSQVVTITVTAPVSQDVWINEIHYDNDGTDASEGVEVAGIAGTDLTGYSLVPYNGSGGLQYSVTALSGSIDDEGAGFGAVWFAILGLQNGAPDGVALVDDTDAVIQYLSYEGTFAATDGPAVSMTSTDIGVAEPGALDTSLQLIGTGSVYSAFTWTGPVTHSRGLLNVGQTLTGGTASTVITFSVSSAIIDESGGAYTVSVQRTSGDDASSAQIELSGDAGAGDYSIGSTNISFGAGILSVDVVITIIDDSDTEGAEDIILTLVNGTGGTIGLPSVFTLTIKASDLVGGSLMISQYIETDSGTAPKGIEIWNASGSDITFDDTANLFDLQWGNNGTALASLLTITNGTLVAGDVWVIGTTNMNPDIVKVFTFNGDDALAIELGGVVQDVFGNPGSLPSGGAWSSNGVSTANQNIQLKDGITVGDPYGWTDPSIRFEYVDVGTVQTGFGTAPGGGSTPDYPDFNSNTVFNGTSGQIVFDFDIDDTNLYSIVRATDLTLDPAFTDVVASGLSGVYTQDLVGDGVISTYRIEKD